MSKTITSNKDKKATESGKVIVCTKLNIECGRRDYPEFIPCATCSKFFGGCGYQKKMNIIVTISE